MTESLSEIELSQISQFVYLDIIGREFPNRKKNKKVGVSPVET